MSDYLKNQEEKQYSLYSQFDRENHRDLFTSQFEKYKVSENSLIYTTKLFLSYSILKLPLLQGNPE